jgi:hypothetical protein
MDSTCSGQYLIVGSYECGNKLSHSVKAGKFFAAAVSCDVTPCSAVDRYLDFGDECCFHLQGRKALSMQKQYHSARRVGMDSRPANETHG